MASWVITALLESFRLNRYVWQPAAVLCGRRAFNRRAARAAFFDYEESLYRTF